MYSLRTFWNNQNWLPVDLPSKKSKRNCWQAKSGIQSPAMLRSTPALTVCDLKLGFGQNAARHRQGLADIVPGVAPLDSRDGQISTERHWKTAVGLLRLIRKQKVLHKRRRKEKSAKIIVSEEIGYPQFWNCWYWAVISLNRRTPGMAFLHLIRKMIKVLSPSSKSSTLICKMLGTMAHRR